MILIDALLTVAVALFIICGLGILIMSGVYNKLHYLAPASVLGTAAVCAAVIVEEGMSSSGIKCLIIFACLLISGPVLTQAAARAERVRSSRMSNKEPESEA